MVSLRSSLLANGFTLPISLLEVFKSQSANTQSVGDWLDVFNAVDKFTPLPFDSAGVGDVRLDRFRVYFRPDDAAGFDISGEVSQFKTNFPTTFNGEFSGPSIDNPAHVQHQGVEFNGEGTLQFVFDTPGPNFHDDWVGFIEQDSTSFTVQTLRRNFHTVFDDGAPLPDSINRLHFLAGRRSWRIGRALDMSGPEFAAANPVPTITFGPDPASFFVLETASLTRFSHLAFQLADLDPGLFNNMADAIKEIWSVQLRNFVEFRDFSFSENSPPFDFFPAFTDRRHSVFFITGEFDTLAEAKKEMWVRDLLALHPHLVP